MATQGARPFTTEGNIDPVWLQTINNNDALTSEIAAYFLSGEKLRPEVKCLAQICIMPARACSFVNEKTKKTEYNPMMLCFFCDRTFHAGCCDLDQHLIREESVPWRCKDCQKNLLNSHCQTFYNSTGYKVSLLERRGPRLLAAYVPEKANKFKDVEFLQSDIQSFERRAIMIMEEEDPDFIADPKVMTPLLLKQVMKARNDRKASVEAAERYRAEMEKKDKELRELRDSMMKSSLAIQHETLPSSSAHDTSAINETSISFQDVRHSSMIAGGSRASNLLTSHYRSQETAASIETNNFQYRPMEIIRENPNMASGNNSSVPINESQQSINASELSALISRLTVVQERSEDRHLLEARRKAMPKMCDFNGDDSKWLMFRQDVERYRLNCKFDDETVKLYMRGALKGDAYNIVKDIFDTATLDEIMAILKASYGDEMRLIRNRSTELMNFKFSSTLYKTEAVRLQSAIQAYFAACNYAKIGYINTNVIAEAIFNQFNAEDRQRCKEFYRLKNPTAATIVMDVQTIYDFIMYRLPLLDDEPAKNKEQEADSKSKSKFQINSVSTSSGPTSEHYKFEIRDVKEAPYIGYDLERVALVNKDCEICSSTSHFSLQCPRFKEKNDRERIKLILDKRLCKNCLLTSSHRASNCNLKPQCGFKTGQLSRCSAKHHIAIHEMETAFQAQRQNQLKKRKSNTRNNTAKAIQKVEEAKNEVKTETTEQTVASCAFHALDPKEVAKHYNVILSVGKNVANKEVPKTVKVFRIKFWGPKGHVVALAIGDSGSEVTLMREDLREALGIKGEPHTLNLQWADRTTRTCNATQFKMQIQGMEEGAQKYDMENCFALRDLNLPERTLDMKKLRDIFPHLKNVPFEGYHNEEPVMLIGSGHANLIEGCELVEDGPGPIAVKTRIGWTVYGGSIYNADQVKSVKSISQNNEENSSNYESQQETNDPEEIIDRKISNEELHKLLVKHFSVESLGIRAVQNFFTVNERKAIELLEEETKILKDGSVEVPLLWNRRNKEIPKLPNNYPMVLQRQLAQEKKLKKNPEHLKRYNDNVKEMLSKGFLREATDQDMKGDWPNIWYLPMSLVINENKVPPKFRNVYDASCVYQGDSLNQCLLKGPDFLVNILQPLLRMRMNKIAFTADVKSMFHMVKICKRDQQVQRVLWRESDEMPMKTYIADVMLFGPRSSPVSSQYVKNETAKLWADKYPEAAQTLIDFTYMDDVLTSEPTVEKAKAIAEQCIEICKSINWELTGFQSNCVELLKKLPSNLIKAGAIPLPDDDVDDQVTKVLGCQWNTIDDCFEFKLDDNLFIQMVNEFNVKPTKRDQASTVARIYDSQGLLSHFTIRGKILLQRSWEQKVDWDDVIDDQSAKDWKVWLQQLKEVAKLKFPRRFSRLNALTDAKSIHLHVFSDAGKEAYGTVAYLVVKSDEGIDTSLVMSKAKVTPLRIKSEMKVTEMPRLELLAALIGLRLGNTIKKLMKGIDLKTTYWCDSEVVLRWILSEDKKFANNVVGPIVEILENSDRNQWRYVPTQFNVADLCTKLKKFDFSDESSVWMNGPDFIKADEIDWPTVPEKLLCDDFFVANNIYFEKLNYSSHFLPPIDCPIANDEAIDRLSASTKASWPKLTRAVARALKLHLDALVPLVMKRKFCNEKAIRELSKLTEGLEYLSPKDYERAEHFIFRKIQREQFPKEYEALRKGQCFTNQIMLQLNVFLDPQGIIRINARTDRNSESQPQQFAPLLGRKNDLVTALLEHYHYKHKHIMLASQVAEIRTKVWIPQLYRAMRSIRANCNYCNLQSAKPYSPQMAPLPDDRVNPDLKPFEVVGIDVLGPLKPTVNGNVKKVYILIFVCTLTRYVHLHILDSLESLRVLEAIVVFWTAYGPVRKFISDNGSNFKKTAKLLREDFENAQFFENNKSILGPKLSELYKVEWQFNAVYAPWFGGMYERLIKDVKRALETTLDKRKINRVELNIAVQEAAHRLNCRPLTETSIDAFDGEILTPHHLAKNKSGWPLLPGIHKNVYKNVSEKSIYRRGRIVADEFMRKFTAEYLPMLTKRSKWHKTETPPQVGDLVLMIEPNETRKEWQRAKIIKLHPGRDGIVRAADVELPNGKIKLNRAVRNLAKIKISRSLTEELNSNGERMEVLTVNAIFENEPTKANFKRVYNLKTNSINPKMNNTANTKTFLLQIDGVDDDISLSSVVQTIAAEYLSIRGIFRQWDYKKAKPSETLFVLLMDELEFQRSINSRPIVNAGNGIKINFPGLRLGTAYFPGKFENLEADRIKSCPKPVAVFNLPLLSSSTSGIVADILARFEQEATISGFLWCMESKRIRTRNFGFIYTVEHSAVFKLVNRSLKVNNLCLNTVFADSVAVLFHPNDERLMNERKKAIFSELIAEKNWLNCDFRDLASDEEHVENSMAIAPAESIPFTKDGEKTPAHANFEDDDALILTLSHEETLDLDDASIVTTALHQQEACCSRSVTKNNSDLSISVSNLQEYPTVPIGETASFVKEKKDKSRFIKLTIHHVFPFSEFLRKLKKYILEYEIVVVRERKQETIIFVEFKEIANAHKFKKVIEGLRREKQDCSVRYTHREGKDVADKGKNLNFKVKPGDAIYVLSPSGLVHRKNADGPFTLMYSGPPENVETSQVPQN